MSQIQIWIDLLVLLIYTVLSLLTLFYGWWFPEFRLILFSWLAVVVVVGVVKQAELKRYYRWLSGSVAESKSN